MSDIRQVKLIHIPGLAWLISPRLVVRAGGLASIVFHASLGFRLRHCGYALVKSERNLSNAKSAVSKKIAKNSQKKV